jgi:hypothetical protein
MRSNAHTHTRALTHTHAQTPTHTLCSYSRAPSGVFLPEIINMPEIPISAAKGAQPQPQMGGAYKACILCGVDVGMVGVVGQYYGMSVCRCRRKKECAHAVVCKSHGDRFVKAVKWAASPKYAQESGVHKFCNSRNKCTACRRDYISTCLAIGMTQSAALEAIRRPPVPGPRKADAEAD